MRYADMRDKTTWRRETTNFRRQF